MSNLDGCFGIGKNQNIQKIRMIALLGHSKCCLLMQFNLKEKICTDYEITSRKLEPKMSKNKNHRYLGIFESLINEVFVRVKMNHIWILSHRQRTQFVIIVYIICMASVFERQLIMWLNENEWKSTGAHDRSKQTNKYSTICVSRVWLWTDYYDAVHFVFVLAFNSFYCCFQKQ